MLRTNFFGALAAVAFSAVAIVPASAKDIVMNLGFDAPEESTYGVLARLFKDRVEKYSNGSIEVKIRCCGQIASEDTAFKAMQLGTVDGYFVTSNNIAPHWSLMDVTVLPYIFQSPEHMHSIVDGPIGEKMADTMQKATGVHLLTFGAPQYRDFYNSKLDINVMADLAGLKVRVPNNPVMMATFAAFGAQPIPMPWSETPTALQTGTVDGSDNGTTFIKDMKFYEFEKHLTILDHFVSLSPMLASGAFMKRLDEDQRAAVLRAAKEAGEEHTKLSATETEDVRAWLGSEGGMSVTRPDKAEFIAAAKAVQQDVAKDRGPEFVDLV
jgi:tripartite ATP-independent transporter DctP family solute receptor